MRTLPWPRESFSIREMISLFLLIFAFQDGLATEDSDLRQIVNSLQLTVNGMSGKMVNLENEVKVRVVLVMAKAGTQIACNQESPF